MSPRKTKKVLIRKVKNKDSKRILSWRNDPITRQNSFTSAKVSLENHKKWFERILQSDSSVLLIAEKANHRPFGVVRYDRLKKQDWEVHINLAPNDRGKGWGQKALQSSQAWLKRNHNVSRIVAKIKKENSRSIQAFENAGFKIDRKQKEMVIMKAR